MKGYIWALCSVALVTSAQLMLRWAMTQLPMLSEFTFHAVQMRPLMVLFAGLTCYGLSMCAWLLALRHLPLSRAYPLLSLSYVLVWALALLLPFSHEPYHPGALVGVIAIVIGLTLTVKRS